MNLLIDNWIPVQLKGEFKYISLKRLLCEEKEWQITCNRDDMELATLQLAVCLVQVVFMPEGPDALRDAWETPMKEPEYEQGIKKYFNWFDLLHPKTPFMQKADIKLGKIKKGLPGNWASLHKLFIGLPERTSGSETSNAFFNRVDEIETSNMADATVALFQQATNGLSFGSHFYSVGLKGLIPLTTLVMNRSLRKTVWCNVLSRKFLKTKTNLIQGKDQPTWVVPPKKKEQAHTIGILRGLFWQPAKVKLKIKNKRVTGFFKETGPCEKNGHWLHPHTPMDMTKFQKNKNEDKPYLTAKRNSPMWSQMMSFFYLSKEFSPTDREGFSSALVVQQYKDVWRKDINLSVGGYVIGKSIESLAGRKHEVYSLSSGWKEQVAEIKTLIYSGLESQGILNHAVKEFGRIAIEKGAISRKERRFKANLKKKAKNDYFNNSEQLVHSIFRRLNMKHLEFYKRQFAALAKQVFENLISPYEHEAKMQHAIIISRALLENRLKKM